MEIISFRTPGLGDQTYLVAHEGKAVLCGDATVGDGTATPFVMRGGYLVLPADASPDQFATLQAMCTESGPAPAP